MRALDPRKHSVAENGQLLPGDFHRCLGPSAAEQHCGGAYLLGYIRAAQYDSRGEERQQADQLQGGCAGALDPGKRSVAATVPFVRFLEPK